MLLQVIDPVCHQLYDFYRSMNAELQRFTLELVPALLWTYVSSVYSSDKKVMTVACTRVQCFLTCCTSYCQHVSFSVYLYIICWYCHQMMQVWVTNVHCHMVPRRVFHPKNLFVYKQYAWVK